jgi:hypothetical protein
MIAVKAKVRGYDSVLTMSDGSVIERDFTFLHGPAFDKLHRRDGIDRRVRLRDGELSWPGDINFNVDAIVLCVACGRRRRPMKRAIVVSDGSLSPAPWVKSL